VTFDQNDKRREERVRVEFPVDLGGADGLTSDVSASGMFFETSTALEIGDTINFSVEFDAPGGKRILRCSGNIVRTVVHDNRLGVGVRIVESRMEGAGTFREDRAAVNNL